MSSEPKMPWRHRVLVWVKRLGFWGFLFFLVKGLLWLILPWLLARGIFS